MADQGKSGSAGKSGKPDGKDDREARLAAALKANLRRRKAQARARSAGPDAEEG